MPPLRRQPLVSMALHLALIVFQCCQRRIVPCRPFSAATNAFHTILSVAYLAACHILSEVKQNGNIVSTLVNHSSLTKVMARVCNYFMPKAKVYQAHRSLSQVSFNFLTCRAKLQARQLLRLIC